MNKKSQSGLNVKGLRQELQTTRALVSPSSDVIRSRASPATSSRKEPKNPAIRSYRLATYNRVARKSFKGLRREEYHWIIRCNRSKSQNFSENK